MNTLEQLPRRVATAITARPVLNLLAGSAAAGAAGRIVTGIGLILYRRLAAARSPHRLIVLSGCQKN